MTHVYSAHALAGTKTWEEFVGFVYDDKVAPRVIDGRRQYVEWDGGPVRGTLTFACGHTDAAGAPKLTQGMRCTEPQAVEILGNDLAPVTAQVNRDVKVPLTQGQFDALVDFCFNCGEGALRHLIVKLNQGNYDDIPGHMMQYIMSKGERMAGLVNRRHFEIGLWNSKEPQAVPLPVLGTDELDNFSPKAERTPPPKTMAASKVAAATGTVGAGGVYTAMAAVSQINAAAEPIKNLKQNAADLGLFDQLAALAHAPAVGLALGAVIVGLAVFIWFDRRSKLVNDHV